MTWPEEVPLSETKIGFVETFEDVQEFFRWLGQKRDVLALDTETSGLSPFEPGARIRLFQVGSVNEAWVIDAQRWPGVMYEVLEKYQGPQVWHNIAFDAKWIQVLYPDLKFAWSRSNDTMLMHRLHDNEASAALKPIAKKYWGPAAVAGQDMLKETMANTKTSWADVPLEAPAYRIYSGVDVILGARLYRKMSHVHSGEFKRAYQLEMEARRICTQMEIRGMRIDREYCKTKSDELDEYVEKAIEYASTKWGVKLGSTTSLGRWFVAEGADILDMTATGLPKMDEDSLKHLINQGYELADLALKTRKATKIRSTYLENFLEFSKDDGTVHPDIITMAAKTGRMSIKNPALQTLPRDDVTVRPSVIPHEGQVLLSSDYDQIEFRYISHLCGDLGLKTLFEEADAPGGLDVFTQIGREVFSDPSMVKKDPRRATIKTLIYARNYGAGVAKQALSAGVPKARMQEISDNFDHLYPGLNTFNSNLTKEMQDIVRSGERPYVTTFTGRRLYVPADRAYTAGNYLVQGSCAEVLKEALVDLSMNGLDDNLVLPVHDEVLVSCDKGDAEEIAELINESMINEQFSVRMPAACGEPMERWVKQ
ncbi:hypothetical protein PP301_gp118 [Gordonia phage GMA2]|uniref:DNA-directed DNA polymerase family A palm domain-containing protein n=1 Tax=Gordonia phage GMA2 TaxID=1647283 RepID=A0A0K0N6N8_9CAUD|nr:hypothetical protein PP301_gp118 [Gordonia phage GMA2]AKJ72604.1 hypothetical protein GMA2_66 [Gordonia phage GMA2]